MDLQFSIGHNLDFVALSLVSQASHVIELKDLLATKRADIQIIAKLENPEAIDDLENILEATDGVMIARGGLGVEMSPGRVPFLQKTIIQRADASRVPVITATEMLESMISHPRSTRAEACDVANAVFVTL